MKLKAVVCGAGEVGTHIASLLAVSDHDVTVIDTVHDRVEALADNLDISTLTGNCTNSETLQIAQVQHADLVVACTNQDEVNLLTAAIAKALGAKRTVARVEHRMFFESRGFDYCAALGVDGMICPDYSTARAIARALRNPGSIAIEDFGHDEIEMQEFRISDDSPALGRKLADLKLPRGSLLAVINHDGSAFVPDGGSVVNAGDTIVLVSNADVFQQARRIFLPESHAKKQEVVITNGSAIAVWLCRALHDRQFSVRLFEPDKERATELGNKLEWVTVLQQDVIDPAVFEEEKIGQADVFVACGDDDEQNILSCVWAKSKGAKKVVAVSGRSDYLGLLKQIGIDFAFSPRKEEAEEIEHFLVRSPLRRLSSLAGGDIHVYRVPIGSGSKTIGKTIAETGREIAWIIATIRRLDRSFVPTADTKLEQNDVLVIVGGTKLERTLAKLFDAEKE